MGRLIIDSHSRANAAAGLKRYNGKGIFSSISRKALLTGLRKVVSVSDDDGGGLVANNIHSESIGKQADEMFDLKEGEGIVYDSIDGFSMPDEETCTIESTSRSSEKEEDNSDHRDAGGDDDDESMNQSVDQVADGKRKIPPSFIDSIINGTVDGSQSKIRRLDNSIIPESNEGMPSKKSEHTLSKIAATEKKMWPQKPCVVCRRRYGVRHDTRYICILCNVALCKEPCFSEYHCNK